MSVSIQLPPTIPLKQLLSLRDLLDTGDLTVLAAHIVYGLRCLHWDDNTRLGVGNDWTEDDDVSAQDGTETYDNVVPLIISRVQRTLKGDSVVAHKYDILSMYASCATFKLALDSMDNPQAVEPLNRTIMITLNWLVMGRGFNNSEVGPDNPLAYPDAYAWANDICIRAKLLT